MLRDSTVPDDWPRQEVTVLPAPLDQLEVVQAEPSDLDAVLDILQEAVQWLASQGVDQWQWPDQFPRQRNAQAIERGEMYVAKLADEPVATFSLQWADPNIWSDAADDAGYVHRLAVRRSFAGQGIGLYLLRWAERAVAETGKAYLRLDCMAENERLCAYYERAGFTYRGEASGEVCGQPWRAALYEKNLESSEAKNTEVFSLRAAASNDYDFLYDLKVATMKEYVAATWGWDDADQEESFRQRFKPDGWNIIVVDNQDVGALRVRRKEMEIHLVNIAILPQYQGHGLGSRIINSVLEEARDTDLPVTLQVLKVNPARGLYERLGFTVIGETETHYLMSTT